ncbi:MAG: TatD family hydrolase [Pseudomonadota bacterium]
MSDEKFPTIDSHCHLDYFKSVDPAQVIREAKERGVFSLITIAVSPDNLGLVLDLATKYPDVYCTQGIHPHQAKLFDQSVANTIRHNCQNAKVRAIGEIGLDYHYNHSPQDVQKEAFHQQLQLATDLSLPVVLHTREAENDTMNTLKAFPSLKGKVLVHSFTSHTEFARWALDQDFYFGFNGIITFKGAQDLRDILKFIPLDKILLETDSPFLAPVPHRGRENYPANIPLIAQAIAKIKRLPPEQIAQQTTANCCRFFSLK